jgi:primosomal protein N' (replication factor Y)
MNILKVVPFKKAFKAEYLTYFTTKDVSIGNIVTFEIKNKTHQGFVVDVENAETTKSDLKHATFSLKKIKSVYKETIFNSALVQTLKDAETFYATSTGALSTLIAPAFVLKDINTFKIPYSDTIARKESTEQYAIQEPDAERYSSYKRLIREEFAKKKSVLFVCPTIEDAEYAFKELSKGIVENSYLFASHIKGSELSKKWSEAIKNIKPILVVATGHYAFAPLSRIGSVVIEKESSRQYKTQFAPYADYRVLLEMYAKNLGARYVVGDLVLRLESHIKIEQFTMHEYSPLKFRALTTAQSEMVAMNSREHTKGDELALFSQQMVDMLERAHLASEHVLLLCARKGLSPTVLCMDCGNTVRCTNCDSPMVLHGTDATQRTNYFLCHRCNEHRHAGELCKNCNSWRLRTLGVSTDSIEQYIKEKFPNASVFVFNGDRVKTQKQARKMITDFYNTPGAILIGTEMALLYTKEEIEHIGIVSIDSMLSIPDFSIHERILTNLLRAKSLASRTFILQTRNPDSAILGFAHTGNIREFVRSELKERKTYDYPPYSMMILLTLQGTPAKVQEEAAKIKQFLKGFELFGYPILTQTNRNRLTYGLLIRLEAGAWPNPELAEKLRALPQYIKVVIQADNIF